MLLEKQFAKLQLELSVKAKNGLDFILAASIVWAAIAFVWTLPNSPTLNGFITFFVGAAVLPLAWLFSKLLGTTWTIAHNPLQPLGLWLNFAQLFYFPILLFIYSKHPAQFIMTYGIITGAHFFPYAWFYKATPYAIMAGVIAVGCLVLGLRTPEANLYLIPGFVAAALMLLGGLLYVSYRQNEQVYLLLTAQSE
ncbi:hypothetical protein J0X19_18585 [Hymenobacter sp. BT186]|uniref:Uncharacterized protein n=1 Tax=Hymenobacter telluris TaxID=2816474 RepID=A0A939EZD2_9BACT|nr:hypothetical protein [Hymenobacter telluris]MBO0359974.1 hypothetical protein [Hymenobacter telluris]MBW3376001.1 hypothetical protein [Hymenobacter norwichensis]